VIRSTFRLAPGVGASMESRIWATGALRWDDLPAPPATVISPRVDGRIREAVARARALLEARDAGGLAAMLPRNERWRLYGAFVEEAAFLDVEADGDALLAVGVLDARGPHVYLAGRDLPELPARVEGWKVLVTFNGLAFDVPVLRRAFRGLALPRAHVDLRHLWARLGHDGGLKVLEHAQGLRRPPYLDGLDGAGALRLWGAQLAGEPGALRAFAEYNLLDTVHLRTLADRGYNRMIERLRLPAPRVPVTEPGDLRYDVTRWLLAL
jgi:hypothetical protein